VITAVAALLCGASAFKLVPLGNYTDPQVTSLTYDPVNKRVYVLKPPVGSYTSRGFDIMTIDGNGQFLLNRTVDIAQDAGPVTPFALEVYGGKIVAVAVQGVTATGSKTNRVLFYEAGGFFVLSVEVGSAPRAMKFTSDGTKLIVANSGFIRPSDPTWGISKGSVTVITIPAKGVSALTQAYVTTVDLSSFDGSAAAIASQLNKSLSFSDEVYPTSLSLGPNDGTVYVVAQPQNLLLTFDVPTLKFTSLKDLGTVRRADAGFDGLSNSKAEIKTYDNVESARFPADIATATISGYTFIATANTGLETSLISAYGVNLNEIDPSTVNEAVVLNLGTLRSSLPFLKVVKPLGNDLSGRKVKFVTAGARSWSLFDSAGNLVFDSGADFETTIAQQLPNFFNAGSGLTFNIDEMSPVKGPEPLSIATGNVAGEGDFFFITSASTGGIYVYQANTRTTGAGTVVSPQPVSYYNFRASFNATNAVADAIAVAATDQYRMEDSLQFVRLDQSPFEFPMLLSTAIGSRTLHSYALIPDACVQRYGSRLASFKFSVFLDDVPLTVLSNGAAATGSSSFVNRYVENYAVVPNTGKLRCTWTIYNQLGNVVNQGENTLTVSAAPAKVNLGINDRLTAADSCAPKARGRAFLTVKHTPVTSDPSVNNRSPATIVAASPVIVSWDWMQKN